MRVDFYQLTRDPVAHLLPDLAERTLAGDKRMAILADDALLIDAISEALWTRKPESFLAHGVAGEEQEADQPILLMRALADGDMPPNKAGFLAIADGQWRDHCDQFERIFFPFEPGHIDAARSAWKSLKDREGVTRHYWKQDGRRWVEQG
ncbi:DNA polymerase III subunit chi [Alterisphingorhabdus coralli]|uniref:DNA polymerase III subunit chi n=1 Tax=Alterisphingorhabdus coralli TaxID=3071408 RepID=A0AA97I0Z3_9SPHN|nr:DNA polymerase III subunit chi [Parasphingorhabdus sp. SCSIO 66989]WOE74255.1 DNA polymerase III subunit chi [Parasphingorhabdus sp. SCSIO 66989]